MIKTDWYTLIPLEYSLDKLLVWARTIQVKSESKETIGDVSSIQRFWMGSAPQELWDEVNKIMPCLSYWDGGRLGQTFGPRSTSIWEYPVYDELKPHIDNRKGLGGYPGKTSLIIPLIGRFETWYFTDESCKEKGDSVVYSPGNIFVMKNWDRYHGGRPLDGYRLCLHIFSEDHIDDIVEGLFE